jgi:hypothetical protein
VTRLLDRVPTAHRDGFASLLAGGELRMAVEDLLTTLVDDQVPVTPAEREDVRRLLEYLKQPLDKLDHLHIQRL